MFNKPLVSVIIPSFNHEFFLKQRLDSVLKQFYQNFELIILDDASTDNSLDILNTYKNHPKVSHFIVNDTNSGSPFVQWEKGIKLAKGEFIWIAETDDFAERDFLEKTTAILDKKPSSSLIYTDARIVDENGKSIGFWSEKKNLFFQTNRWSKTHDADGKDEILNYLLYKVTINNVSSVLFRSKYLKEHQFINALINYNATGDLFTYLNMALKGDVSYCHLPLNNYRSHSQNATHTNKRNGIIYKERLQCYLHLFEEITLNFQADFRKPNRTKPFLFILKKNVFQALEFNHYEELKNYVWALKSLNIISKVEYKNYMTLFWFYKWNHLKSKQISRHLIKLMVSKRLNS